MSEADKYVEAKPERKSILKRISISPFASRFLSVNSGPKVTADTIPSWETVVLKENELVVLEVDKDKLIKALLDDHNAYISFDGTLTDYYYELKDGTAVEKFGDWPRIRRTLNKEGEESFEFTIKGADIETDNRGFQQDELNMDAETIEEAIEKMRKYLGIPADSDELYVWSKMEKERTSLISIEDSNEVTISIDKFVASEVTAINESGEFKCEPANEEGIPHVAEFEILYPDPGDDEEENARVDAMFEYRKRLMRILKCEPAKDINNRAIRNITDIQRHYGKETHKEKVERLKLTE